MTTQEKRKPGRPSLPPNEKRRFYVQFRVTQKEHDFLVHAAEKYKESISEYCRSIIVDLAAADLRGELD